MIAFGWDKDVPVTPLQRVARGVLVSACSVLGLGVITSIVLTPAGALPPPRFVARNVPVAPLPFMAGETNVVAPPPRPIVELVHDVAPPARSTTSAAHTHVVWMNVTAYCPCAKCCGKDARGITASGKPITASYGHFVAAPATYAFGSKVIIPGYNRGRPVPVLDRGGVIKGDHLDVFFPTHEKAKAWGRQWIAVTVVD